MRLSKVIISVSKRHKNNHAGVKNGTWAIYYYDEDGKIQTKRINPLLILYYKLKRYHRTKGMCPNCYRGFTIFSNRYDRNKNPNCPYCLEEDFDEYDD